MTLEDRNRLFALCMKGKTVGGLTSEEMRFAERMLAKFPDDYRQIELEAKEEVMAMMNPLYKRGGKK